VRLVALADQRLIADLRVVQYSPADRFKHGLTHPLAVSDTFGAEIVTAEYPCGAAEHTQLDGLLLISFM
jgi:hypothetical protein